MKKYLRSIAILMIVLPALSSCKAITSFFSGDEIVAVAGSEKLYRSDLDRILPKGMPVEDSTRLAMQYITTWASDIVYVTIAEEQLSKSEKDVTKELEDYRKSLLKYRYEQLYVNERLDTAVTDDQVQEYFEAHSDKYVLQRPVVKARFLAIFSDSPAKEQIRKRMSSDDVNVLVEADSLAFSAAHKYTGWNDGWVDVAVLSREFGLDYTEVLAKKKGDWVEIEGEDGISRIAYISDMVKEGELAPIEYAAQSIRDMIISARKQKLIMTLEQDLLKDARDNGKFVIY
jgi:hypothetical protein